MLRTRNVANLHTTPPLLEAMARDDRVVELMNDKIRYLLLSGAHVDGDTLDLLRGIFPATTITRGLRQHHGALPSGYPHGRR